MPDTPLRVATLRPCLCLRILTSRAAMIPAAKLPASARLLSRSLAASWDRSLKASVCSSPCPLPPPSRPMLACRTLPASSCCCWEFSFTGLTSSLQSGTAVLLHTRWACCMSLQLQSTSACLAWAPPHSHIRTLLITSTRPATASRRCKTSSTQRALCTLETRCGHPCKGREQFAVEPCQAGLTSPVSWVPAQP